MREIRKSGSEGGARQTNVSFLPLSKILKIMQAIFFRFRVGGCEGVEAEMKITKYYASK